MLFCSAPLRDVVMVRVKATSIAHEPMATG